MTGSVLVLQPRVEVPPLQLKHGHDSNPAGLDRPSPSELEVLRLVVGGCENSEIAKHLAS